VEKRPKSSDSKKKKSRMSIWPVQLRRHYRNRNLPIGGGCRTARRRENG
jgi:hypothetical protein